MSASSLAPRKALAALCMGLLAVTACESNTEAVAIGGSFEFVSPGGQTEIFYDPPAERGSVGEIAGENLMEEGQRLSLADFPDQVIVLNTWGQWCGPCRSEVDDLVRVHEASVARGATVFGLNVRDENRSEPQDFVRAEGVPYPSIWDPAMRSLLGLRGFPTSVIPTTIILDRQHRVAAVYLREITDDLIQPVVDRLLAEGANA